MRKSGGIQAGYTVEDIKVTLYDGSYHKVDSSEMAFKLANSMAFRKGAKKENPVILEPIMKVEVEVPEEYMGDVIGDIFKRRGQVNGMGERGENKVIDAFVPLAEMFGYSTDLRSMTQGVEQLILWNLTIMKRILQILQRKLLKKEIDNFYL